MNAKHSRPRIHRLRCGAPKSVLAAAMAVLPLIAARAPAPTEAPTTFSVLHNFTGASGAGVYGSLTADAAGNLYGPAFSAGSFGFGLIFKLDPSGRETVLYNFTGGTDGGHPFAGLTRDESGNLYGTTVEGGNTGSACRNGSSGCGVAFKLDPAGQETVLYTFTGGADGSSPQGSLIRDADGNLYGTTANGGKTGGPCGPDGCGVVFKIDTSGQESVLYAFAGTTDGAFPGAGLAQDSDGNLYGTTVNGGSTSGSCRQVSGCGVAFKVSPSGQQTVLHTFTEGRGGAFPVAGLILDSGGNLYGTTFGGGNTSLSCNSGSGCGVVFKLGPSGNETVLYTFHGGPDGWGPAASLLRDSGGSMYGTATFGGSLLNGVIFKLNPAGEQTVLHAFSSSDGIFPEAGLVQNKGLLFGTATQGGSHSVGTVFELQR